MRLYLLCAGGGRGGSSTHWLWHDNSSAMTGLWRYSATIYFEYSIAPYVQAFRNQQKGARVLLKEADDPDRFGVAALDEKLIFQIEEKLSQAQSNHAAVGRYMCDSQV